MHYRAWLASTGTPDSPEAEVTYVKTLSPEQVGRLSQDESAGGQSFWKRVRKNSARSPEPRTMGDVVRQTNQARERAQEQTTRGLIKAKAVRAGEARASTVNVRLRVPGIAGPLVAGRAAAGNELIQLYIGIEAEQKRVRDQGLSRARYIGQQRIYGDGRRGALATRPIARTSNTNRTGAAATRPLSTGSARAATNTKPSESQPTGQSGRQGGAVRSVQGSSGALGSRAISRQAQRGSEQLAQLQRQVQGQLQSLTEQLVSRARAIARSRSSSRAIARPLTRLAQPTSSTTSQAENPLLTSLNEQGLGLQQLEAQGEQRDKRCKCPPKEKRKKDSEPRCRNPVISREVVGDIKTTKVKIVCQPSKRK